ncbi:MAG: PepSY domain-containing protein [Croceivirga sp.]
MTISIWRYSHLTLALVSGLFLVLASVTGIILALEPMPLAVKSYQPEDLSEISLAETFEVLSSEYDEVLALEVDANDFYLADVVTKTGENKSVYINPKTGVILGEPQPQHAIFQFTTNLHRSLFLKGIGRFFVGFVSFLLCLIAVTGLLLIIKRQGGVKKLFSKVQKDYFELRYHVILGRYFLIPIILIATTGVYLSAEKFSLLPPTTISHAMVEPDSDIDMTVPYYGLEIFKNIRLDDIRKITFPFSEFPEDYFEVALRDRELLIHQYTGEILSEQAYPFSFLLSRWSLLLLTGQGSLLRSHVLLLASMSILFFIYTGFVMWRRRIRSTKLIGTSLHKDDCSHIILVGSETGSTYAFAEALGKGLTEAGKSVFVSEINAYTTYKKAEQLIFLTATYGEGEAPTNARNIRSLLSSVQQEQPIRYSVVGFGSLTYPSYCQFAIDLNLFLERVTSFKEATSLYKINNQSFEAFVDWTKQWGSATGTFLNIQPLKTARKNAITLPYEVVKKTGVNRDDTYILHLEPKKKVKFQSGDLWEFVPEEDGRPRWYSVAKYQGELVLSIKKHEFGIVSKLLSDVSVGKALQGGIRRNAEFHFPKKAPEVVLVGNGTGIAPFLGLIDENEKRVPVELYWGGRTKASWEIYETYINGFKASKKLARLHLAFSQENATKIYVQDLLQRDKEQIAIKLEKGAVFMICGALAMQQSVLEVLEGISQEVLGKPLSEFEHQEQLKMDCY